MQETKGFTLVELVVTMVVASIVLVIAIGGFQGMMEENRSSAQANQFLTALHATRSESVKRGVRVSLCPRKYPRANPEECAGNTDWSTGWLLFSDDSGSAGAFDSTDTLLQVWDRLAGKTTLSGTVSSVQYLPSGEVSSATSFTLKPQHCTGEQQRDIQINAVGRPAVSSTTCS